MVPKKTKRRSQNRKLKPVAVHCPFCKGKTSPDYRKTEELSKYITDRAKILPKSRTGLCAKHQRRVAQAVKRSRSIGLLPFTGSL